MFIVSLTNLVIVAVSRKNDDISDFFDMISVLLNVGGASCKRKDMIVESQHERLKKPLVVVKLSNRAESRAISSAIR
jgi:hypothetical protein